MDWKRLVEQVPFLRETTVLARRSSTVSRHIQRLSRWTEECSSGVCILSYPKSGRTWLRVLIGRALQERYGLHECQIAEFHNILRYNRSLPRIAITHDDDPHTKAPHELVRNKSGYRNKNVLLLVRDPHDVLVSSYFQATRRDNTFTGDLEAFIHAHRGGLDSLLTFYNIWAESHTAPRAFLLVRYEDLHAKPLETLQGVFSFAGLGEISNDILRDAIQYGAFENMRKLEESDRFNAFLLRPADPTDKSSFKTRRGKVGDYVEYMTTSQIEYVNTRISRELSPFYSAYYQAALETRHHVSINAHPE